VRVAESSKSVGAGRGLLFITGAKLWFMVAGYVVQFALPRALGSPAKFGVWGVVLAWISTVNNVMVTATIQGVSKFTSESASESRHAAVTRAGLRMQALLGAGVAGAFFLLAPAIAWFERDDGYTPYLRLASGVVLAYSFYAVFVGSANGARAFHKQAALDATFSTLRAAFVVGAALVAHSALASIGGFVAAAFTILVIAFLVVGPGAPPNERFPTATLARFFGGLAVYLLIVNLLMFVDIFLLKRLVTESGGAAVGDAQSGFYQAAQTVARIPYQLMLAVTFVIFPLVSQATFEKDVEKTRGYVEATMRYSFVVTALLASTLAARPQAIMGLFYKPEYGVGTSALAALLAGYVAFSLFNIAGTIINGAGRTKPTFVIGALTLAIAAGADWAAIRMALASGGDPLLAAGLATAAAMVFGLVLSLAYLQREFGAALGVIHLVRTSLAAVAALAVGRAWPTSGFLGGKVGTLIAAAASGLAFLGVAIVSGELRPAELARLRKR
jgi:stage V sporulation protein B